MYVFSLYILYIVSLEILCFFLFLYTPTSCAGYSKILKNLILSMILYRYMVYCKSVSVFIHLYTQMCVCVHVDDLDKTGWLKILGWLRVTANDLI